MTRSLFDEPSGRPTGAFRVGTSGWSYPRGSGPGSWTGAFYPRTRVDELRFYSRYFNTVEVNSTFYRPCSPEASAKWAERTPDDFEFAVKAWMKFTHERKDWTEEDIRTFSEGIRPLAEAGKLGCLLFQFPASFQRTPGNETYLEYLLDLTSIYPSAVELRHQSWSDFDRVLDERGTIPVFIDEPKFDDSIVQQITPSSRLYLRFHGRRADKWWRHEHRNERYDYLYARSELEPVAQQLKDLVESGPVRKAYVFFNNHPEAKSVVNAVMLRAELGIPVEEALPEELMSRYPDLRRGTG